MTRPNGLRLESVAARSVEWCLTVASLLARTLEYYLQDVDLKGAWTGPAAMRREAAEKREPD